jgi:ubiquinone/menaquinone biosynthesis C-methylase UbiE
MSGIAYSLPDGSQVSKEEYWKIVQDRYVRRANMPKPKGWTEITRSLAAGFKSFIGTQGTILDIGCGTGKWGGKAYADAGVDYIKSTNTIIGLDPEKTTETRFPVVCAFGEDIPFQDNIFDAVVIATTLDHVLDPDEVLMEARRVLKQNAHLFVWNAVFEQGESNPWHLHTWSSLELTDLINKYLKVTERNIAHYSGGNSIFIKGAKSP